MERNLQPAYNFRGSSAGLLAPRLRCSLLYRREALRERDGFLGVSLLHPIIQRLPCKQKYPK